MREHVTPTPQTPREIVFQHALILRRLSGQMRSVLLEPETIPMPASLRRSLTDGVRIFEECAGDLEDLGASASHTIVRVPTWRDGAKLALGVIVPCAAFLALMVLLASAVSERPADPQDALRIAEDREWMQRSERDLQSLREDGDGSR